MERSLSDELYHYGILGMKWGIRRTPEQLGHTTESAATKVSKELSKMDTKASKLEKKASKYNFKAAKAKVKAMKTGSGKKYAKAAKLEMRSAKYEYKATKKYQDAKKFASLINEVFADSNVNMGDIDPAYISLGKQYGLSMFEETKKKS